MSSPSSVSFADSVISPPVASPARASLAGAKLVIEGSFRSRKVGTALLGDSRPCLRHDEGGTGKHGKESENPSGHDLR